MASHDVTAQITALLAPLAEKHGLELWNVDVGGVKGSPLVRVYLDREGGIDIDAIAAATTWIGDVLDVLGSLSGPYTLEVSSPGAERVLRSLDDFRRFIGEKAQVKLKPSVSGRKTFTGVIESVGDDSVTLGVDPAPVEIWYDTVSKAHLRVDFDFGREGSGR